MCGTPLETLVGAAPALQRTISTGTLARQSTCGLPGDCPAVAEARHVAPMVGRRVARDLEVAAVAALHCPLCENWLVEPVTLRCGHSLCGKHVSKDGAQDCPVCGESSSDAVRDFLLQQCVETFMAKAEPSAKPEALLPPLKRVRSETVISDTATRSSLSDDRGQLFCGVCLERFPGPQQQPSLLHCGHTLCSACVTRIEQRGRKCPLCKVHIQKSARPSKSLRTAVRFLNALPVAKGAKELAGSADDLREVSVAVLRCRREAAEALAAPLHEAVRQGNKESVESLLSKGADCNTLVLGLAALHVAIHSRQFAMVQVLLDHGGDPALPSGGSNETPLLLASGADAGRCQSDASRLEAMRAILRASNGTKAVRLASSAGATPLYRVVQRLHDVSALFGGSSFDQELEVARMLIKYGADPDAKTIFGDSPSSLVQKLAREELRGCLKKDT